MLLIMTSTDDGIFTRQSNYCFRAS